MVEDIGELVEVKSFAKLNLFLDVLKKRGDGYHEISSIMQTISLHDTLTFEKIERGFHLESTVNIPRENSIKKAYEIFKREVGLSFGVRVKLFKRIPMGTGLGGGSSNAAAILKYLAFQTGLSDKDLLEIAAKVGSDVPFFLKCGTALVSGRGELIERLDDLPKYGVDLAIPRVRISTAEAYSWLREDDFEKSKCSPLELYEAYRLKDKSLIVECSYNVFQEVILKEFWEIRSALKYLEKKNPIVAMMTGSGSAVFGVLSQNSGTFSFVSSNCELVENKKPM